MLGYHDVAIIWPLISYPNLCLQKPERDDWGNGQDSMQAALDLEKYVNQALLDLHCVAEKHGDAQV